MKASNSGSTLAVATFGAGASLVAAKMLDERFYFRKDMRIIMGLGSFAIVMKQREIFGWTIADGLEAAAINFKDKSAIEFDDAKYTFIDWNNKANQVARWALSVGVKRGDVIALIMENRPEHMFIWSGLSKIGAVAALINYNLRDKALLHCIAVASCKRIIFGSECADQVMGVASEMDKLGYELFVQGPVSNELNATLQAKLPKAVHIDGSLSSQSREQVSRQYREGVKYTDAAMYIYTSGTTGLPKAAVVRHAKLDGAGTTFPLQFKIRFEDRIYNSGLPLYHSAANNVGGGICLKMGATLVLRKKFSASKFWDEVRQFNCTVIQYIGELCRYLLATPKSPSDKRHSCRLAVGNGLRPDIWKEFQERFNIKEIGEFYGSTEGNVALFNHCVEPRAQGAVGHMGFLMRKFAGLCTLVEYDQGEGEVVRDPKTGLCIECAPGKPGEAIAEMKGRAAGSFDGYLGEKEQSEKKLLRNVFRKGDCWFRTGDLMMQDQNGYYYFLDRLGDTFRWKGENVATTEVAEVVTKVGGVFEANVYGVQIPGKDGRACCAACTTKEGEKINLDEMAEVCIKKLPSYAMPMFIRLTPLMDSTGTMKLQKNKLRDEGIDITKINDAMFFFDPNMKKYVPLTPEVHRSIINGQARL